MEKQSDNPLMPASIPYPQIIQLENGNQMELTRDTWEKRLLAVEIDKTENEVREVFKKEGFKEEMLEFTKNGQLGLGLSKKINDWQVHVRLFYHNNRIQIDGEVEVSNKYLEHLTHGWISAFTETWNIIVKHFGKLWVYHKGVGKYVTQVVKQGMLMLPEPKSKTDWLELGFTLFTAIVAGLVIAKALKS